LDLESGEVIVSFTGEDNMTSCAVAPDGRTVIAGDSSGRLHFLRLLEADKTKPAIGDRKVRLLNNSGQGRPIENPDGEPGG
jgi:hypothetical protein